MPTCATRRLLLCLALPVAFAPASAAPPQTYRLGESASGAEPALVDFLVRDRNGRPVLDLKSEEVTLKVDGRARAVGSLQLIDFSEASGASLSPSGETLPPPFGSNVMGASRSVVILIDEDSIRPGRERATLAAVDELITTVSPRTRIVIATPHGGWKTALTTDRAGVRRVVSEIVGRAFEGDDVECRTRVTLDAVQTAIAPFSAGAAPTVLVISGGLAGPRQNIPEGGRGLARAAGPAQARPCDLRIEDFLKVADATAATRAHLYVIQPDDVVPVSNMGPTSVAAPDLTAGLLTLSGVGGGKLLHLTPSSGNPLIAAERESSAYYLLAFEPTAAEAPGSAHRVDVQVSRANVTVTRRPQVILDKSAARAVGPLPSAPEAMLRDPRTRRELPLRAAGYALRSSDPASPRRIVVFAEPLDRSAVFRSAAAGLFDAKGQLVSQWTSTAAPSPGPILAGLSAPPGTYRLRVAAVDGAGRAGTADYFVEAALEAAGPLTLSAVMLGVMNNGALRPALEFTTEPNAVALLEIYGDHQGKPISATLEVAESINGPAVLTVPLPVASTGDADRFVATASIPIDRLAPGDYVVRVTVSAQDRPQGRVVRTLRRR
jgi:hypothetical protein